MEWKIKEPGLYQASVMIYPILVQCAVQDMDDGWHSRTVISTHVDTFIREGPRALLDLDMAKWEAEFLAASILRNEYWDI